MPSTYTLNNGIELIATGEQSGTWGDTTNTNLSLVDTALDGQVTVTLPSAGTSGSPNTLAISDGATSDGRNRMVIFNDGGDLGATAYVQLTPNDAEKIIYVRNDLAGSRSIILFQGTYNASNDYELPAGTTAVIYFDGAGSGAVAANVFNNAYFDSLRLGSVSVTAIIDDDTMATASATNIATSESIKAYVDTQVGANNELSEVLANGNTSGGTGLIMSSGDDMTLTGASYNVTWDSSDNLMRFASNASAVFGGSATDYLQIYSDGTNKYIQDTGSGSLFIRGSDLILEDAGGNDYIAMSDTGTGGTVELKHDATTRLTTSSSGVNISGNILRMDGTSPMMYLMETGVTDSNHRIRQNTGNLYFQKLSDDTNTATDRMSIDGGTGDIIFYDTSGNASFVYDESAGSTFNEQGENKDFRVESDSNTHMLFVDAGNNRVGINSGSTPSSIFHILNNDTVNSILQDTSVNGEAYHSYINDVNQWRTGVFNDDTYRVYDLTNSESRIQIYAGAEMVINEGGADRDFRVESDSNTHMLFVNAGLNRVGIGESGPLARLHLKMGGSSRTDGFYITRSDNDNHQLGLWTSGGVMYYDAFTDNASSSGQFRLRHSRDTGSTTTESIFANDTNVVINDGSVDMDFRVESDSNTHMLFVDAGEDRVNIGDAAGSYDLNVRKTNAGGDVGFQVSNRDTSQTSGSRALIALQADVDNDGALEEFLHIRGGTSTNGYAEIVGRNAASLRFQADAGEEIAFNDSSYDLNFRVESDTQSHALFVDASANKVIVGGSSYYGGTPAIFGVNGHMDIGTTSGNAWSLAFAASQTVGSMGTVTSKISGFSTMSAIQFYANNVTGGSQAASINFYTTNSATQRNTGRFINEGAFQVSNDGTYRTWVSNITGNQFINNQQSMVTLTADATSTSFDREVIRSLCNRSQNSGYGFLTCTSGNLGDDEFRLRGDGQAYADGSWNGGGADYAEYFETTTGSAIPRGTTVVLEGNKVRAATADDPASAVIGVIRPKEDGKISAMVGNTAWARWSEKYLTDDFGVYLMEDHNVIEWEEEYLDDEGETRKKSHSYESHNIPDGITVPSDATVRTHDDDGKKFQHRQLNPDYDPNLEYVSREDRDEWVIVGLLGQVRILSGQPVGERWTKMKDISATVEEWFIR